MKEFPTTFCVPHRRTQRYLTPVRRDWLVHVLRRRQLRTNTSQAEKDFFTYVADELGRGNVPGFSICVPAEIWGDDVVLLVQTTEDGHITEVPLALREWAEHEGGPAAWSTPEKKEGVA